jgi:hypothetical protein
VFDSSPACLPGLRFWLPGPVQRAGAPPGCQRGLSVLARAVSRRADGSWTTPGLRKTRVSVSLSVAFPWGAFGRRPMEYLIEARFLARRCLCLHFTRSLTASGPRLEVKMVRYSFLGGLFHPRLHAGLSRRLRSLTVAALLRHRVVAAIYGAATVRERSIDGTNASYARRRRQKSTAYPWR